MHTIKLFWWNILLSVCLSLVPVLSAHADSTAGAAQTMTAATVPSAQAVTVPAAVLVSPETGGVSIKNRLSIGGNLAYSYYSITNANSTDITTSQTGSIGYLGIFARYGITEDLMLSGECDYLYGELGSNVSGTTIENTYAGFPVSVNFLITIPMNNFNIYTGIGPVYLAGLKIKQDIGSAENTSSGFGAGAQGMIGIETYLSSASSIGLEVRYRHLNLYKSDGKVIAPLDNLSVGLSLILYL